MEFPNLADELRRQRLLPPEGRLRIVLDTDTYNEIDDQFAVVQALLSPDRLDVEAIYAAPFHNARSSGPGDGMEKSYEEIGRLLDRLGVEGDGRVYRGSDRYLPGRSESVDSAAARDLVERSAASDDLLYVVAIGAITNVASAILLDPEIIKRIVVVWLGGQPHHWPSAKEFNLRQDVYAAQTVLNSGVPFVQVPCLGVASHLLTTPSELAQFVKPAGPIGAYLHEIFVSYRKNQFARSKEVWDISAVAYLLDPSWVPVDVVTTPILTDQVTWSFDPGRHSMAVARMVRRDSVFGDLFSKLDKLAQGELQPSWHGSP